MSHEARYPDDIEAYPRHQQEGRPETRSRRQALGVWVLVTVGFCGACALLVVAGVGLIYGLNPMGDEWVCSEGEAPAGAGGAGGACYVEGSTLPAGVEWEPFGNRPMPYNCDKDGWVLIERTVRIGLPDLERDCVREGTDLPGRWHIVRDD
jgi:hypothetical protein